MLQKTRRMRSLLVLLAALVGTSHALAAGAGPERAAALSAARAGMVQRTLEEAAKQPDLLARAHAHPALQLLAWHHALAVRGPVLRRLALTPPHRARGTTTIAFDASGRLVVYHGDVQDGARFATAADLARAGLRSPEQIDQALADNLLAVARRVDPSAQTIATSVPALAQLSARSMSAGDTGANAPRARTLAAMASEGVNSPDAVLLVAMHKAMSGRDQHVALTADERGSLLLRVRDPRERSTGFPRLSFRATGEIAPQPITSGAQLSRLGLRSVADLDRLIEDAMLSIAPEDY